MSTRRVNWLNCANSVYAIGANSPNSTNHLDLVALNRALQLRIDPRLNDNRTSNRVNFTVRTCSIFPGNLNMLVGQSGTLSAKDSGGIRINSYEGWPSNCCKAMAQGWALFVRVWAGWSVLIWMFRQSSLPSHILQ